METGNQEMSCVINLKNCWMVVQQKRLYRTVDQELRPATTFCQYTILDWATRVYTRGHGANGLPNQTDLLIDSIGPANKNYQNIIIEINLL